MGASFAAAYLKIKHAEWNSYASHLSQWELDNTLDC
jgi:glutamine synthetase